MLTEDEANAVMIDIEAMTECGEWGWATTLKHLTRMHKLRDNKIDDIVFIGLREPVPGGYKTHPSFTTFLQM